MSTFNINDTDINIFDLDALPDDNPQPLPEKKKPGRKPRAKTAEVVVSGTTANKMSILEQVANEQFDLTSADIQDKKPAVRKPRAKAATQASTVDGKLDPNKSQEDIDQARQKHIMAIQRYESSDRFGKYLKDSGFNFKNLDKKSLAELESLVNRMRFQVNNKDNNKNLDDMFKKVFAMIEFQVTRGTHQKINLTGLTATLFADEQFLDDLERFRLEYLGFANMDYRVRMIWTISSTAVMINKLNQAGLAHPPPLQRQTNYKPPTMDSRPDNLAGAADDDDFDPFAGMPTVATKTPPVTPKPSPKKRPVKKTKTQTE